MFDAAGAIGPRYWWSRLARSRAERWTEKIIEQVRAGTLNPPKGSAARAIALHRDLDGKLLSLRVAAVELINVSAARRDLRIHLLTARTRCTQIPNRDASWRQARTDTRICSGGSAALSLLSHSERAGQVEFSNGRASTFRKGARSSSTFTAPITMRALGMTRRSSGQSAFGGGPQCL